MLIIFDVDGTLLHSIPRIYKGVSHVFTKCGLTVPSMTSYLRDLRSPYTDFYQSNGVNLSSDEIWQLFCEGCDSEPPPTLFDDVVPCINKLTNGIGRHSLAVVSGNQEGAVREHFDRANITKSFRILSCGHQSKVLPMQNVVRNLGFKIDECLMVGDSMLDVLHAREAGLNVVAILRYPEAYALSPQFIKAGALGCVRSLPEIDRYIS